MAKQKDTGNYDDLTCELMRREKAETILLLVFGGSQGDGLSLSSVDPIVQEKIPELLRFIANQIENNPAQPELRPFLNG